MSGSPSPNRSNGNTGRLAKREVPGGASALPAPPGTPGSPPGRRAITLPGKDDAAGQRRMAKAVYLDTVGIGVLASQHEWFVSDKTGEGATAFVGAIKESVRPRDVIEEMLCLQMAFTHARIAKLSLQAIQQVDRNNVQVVNDACDRAANPFRRQMLALGEYRRPPRSDAFVAIKQANVAAQQVVQNVENQNGRNGIASNEQRSTTSTALPPIADRASIPAGVGAEKSTVAMEQRSSDFSR
jgi:hypothetical protein